MHSSSAPQSRPALAGRRPRPAEGRGTLDPSGRRSPTGALREAILDAVVRCSSSDARPPAWRQTTPTQRTRSILRSARPNDRNGVLVITCGHLCQRECDARLPMALIHLLTVASRIRPWDGLRHDARCPSLLRGCTICGPPSPQTIRELTWRDSQATDNTRTWSLRSAPTADLDQDTVDGRKSSAGVDIPIALTPTRT